jgi:hypothetical protein
MMKPLRGFAADLALFGLAVVFGWAIWYTVREELNETMRKEVDIVIETDPGLDVSPRTQKVYLNIQGPRSAMDAFRAVSVPKLVRRMTLADLPAGLDETRRDFAKEDFEFAESLGGSGLTVVDMKPPVIFVRAFRVEVQEKTVAPPEFPGAADLSLRHRLISYTNTVKVRGAVSVLSTFREIKTYVPRERLAAYAENLRENPKSTVPIVLEIDPAQRDQFVLVEPRELVARVELSRVAEQEMVLPVQILTGSGGAGKTPRKLQFAEINKPHFVAGDPPKLKLMLTGVPSALAGLSTGRLHAFVLADDLADDQRNGDVPVHVSDLPPGVALSQDYSVYVEEAR